MDPADMASMHNSIENLERRRTLEAVKASGAVVGVQPEEFSQILARSKEPLVVIAESGVFKTHYEYLTNYKGLTFYTKSDEMLTLPAGVELVAAHEIWVPD